MRLARVIVGCGCAAFMAASAAAAQEDHGFQVSVAVGGVFSQGAPMAGAQLAAQIPLANPDVQLRFGLQYARSGTTSWPGMVVIDCFGGSCPPLTATDELIAVTAGARFDLPNTGHGLYLIATSGVYQLQVNANPEYGLQRSATGVAVGGGLGTSFSIGRARLFAEGQALIGNVSRGAYEATALFPITVGVRF